MKRILLALLGAMFILTLTGCASSAQDYEKDMQALLTVTDWGVEDGENTMENLKTIISDIKGLKVVTKEGKQFAKTYEKTLALMLEYWELDLQAEEVDQRYFDAETEEEWDLLDEEYDKIMEKMDKAEEQMDELYEKVDEILERFYDEAEKAGVEEDEIERFMDEFSLV